MATGKDRAYAQPGRLVDLDKEMGGKGSGEGSGEGKGKSFGKKSRVAAAKRSVRPKGRSKAQFKPKKVTGVRPGKGSPGGQAPVGPIPPKKKP